MDYDFELTILGSPVAQGRPKARNAGKFIQIYDDPKDRQAKFSIQCVIQAEAPDKLLAGALQVDLVFYMPRPQGHYGSGRNEGNLKDSAPTNHTKKPDIDNLRKLVMDALTNVFWVDDSLVCRGTTTKVYSEKPRTEIYIKIL